MKKLKTLLETTDNRKIYNRCILFKNDYWNRFECKFSKRKHYGPTKKWNHDTKQWEERIKYPEWKLQKVKKQWIKKKSFYPNCCY